MSDKEVINVKVTDLDRFIKNELFQDILVTIVHGHGFIPVEKDEIKDCITSDLMERLDSKIVDYYKNIPNCIIVPNLSKEDYLKIFMHYV